MRHSRTQRTQALRAEQAVHRIRDLRRVYEEGFISRGEFEALKRQVARRVVDERARPSRAA